MIFFIINIIIIIIFAVLTRRSKNRALRRIFNALASDAFTRAAVNA